MNQNQLRNIPPAKLRIILDLMEAGRGKGIDAIMPLFLQANQTMQKQGLRFTPQESQLIIDVLKENLSPAEAQRIEMMQSILSNWQH